MENKLLFSRLLKKAIVLALWTKASLCVKSSLLEQSLPRTRCRLKQNPFNQRNLRLKNSCLCGFVAKTPRNQRNLRLKNSCLCVFCAFLWLKNPCNPCNPWLIKDLRAYKAPFCAFYVSFCTFCASLWQKTSAISAFSAVKNSCLCVFCAFLWLKNPRNLRNPRLMNYLRAFGIFTTVESALQIKLFMRHYGKKPPRSLLSLLLKIRAFVSFVHFCG